MHYTGVIAGLGTLLVVADVLQYRWRRKASWLGLVGCVLLLLDWFLYLGAFVLQDYTLRPVYETSSRGLPLALRVASSWSTSGGSLFLLTVVLALAALTWSRGFSRLRIDHELLVAAFSTLSFLCGAFDSSPKVSAGAGLNPLLRSPWMYPHPLLTFTSYALVLSSAVFALRGEEKRSITLAGIGWVLLTLGIATGGYWSYVTLGWGGYWAWDPVETAELTSWIALTLVLHLRLLDRNLLRPAAMISAGSIFLAALVARVGISPLHSFASSRTITGLILLTLSVAFILDGLRSIRRIKIEGVRADPKRFGLLLSCFSLSTMFLILSFILMGASAGSMMGLSFMYPEMDSGVRFFTLILLPFVLLLLLSMFLYMAGGLISWRRIWVLSGVLLFSSAVLGFMAVGGFLVWSPASPPVVNLMTFTVLPLAAAGLISGVAASLVHLRRKSPSSCSHLLHVALLLIMMGFVLSWPFAYEGSYFKDVDLKAGRELVVDGIAIGLEGCRYGISEEGVYVSAAQIQPRIYERAYLMMRALKTSFAEAIRTYLRGKEILSEKGVLSLYEATRRGLKLGGTYGSEAEVWTEPSNVSHLAVHLSDPVVMSSVERGSNWTLLRIELSGEISLSPALREISAGQVLHLKFLNPLSMRIDNGTLEIYEALLKVSRKPVVSEGRTLLNSTMVVERGRYLEGGKGLEVPVMVKGGTVSLYFTIVEDEKLMRSIELAEESGLSDLLTNETEIMASLPKLGVLPEEARLLMTMNVNGERRIVRLRFDVNGEIQGIHGLVPSVITVGRGLDDVYIVLEPPMMRDESWSVGFHTPLVYYLNRSFENLSKEQRLALTSLLVSAYVGDAVPIDDAASYVLDLYHMAVNFTGSDEVHVRIKVVPCISLLWMGVVLAVIMEICRMALASRRVRTGKIE